MKMNSLRKWLYRPKQSDTSLLAQFFFADEELNFVAAELDSFEGRKDPDRCTALVNQLRTCQARVLNVISQIMDEAIKGQRACRDFRVKFPDDIIQENLSGQLWFGAECLAAGSSIMNREDESACMRPLARALTKNLDSLRCLLREQCLRSVNTYTEDMKESLIIFDKLMAEFELSYVSALVPVKNAHEYDMLQEITVLFSETVQRALKIGLLSVDMIDEYDPALMFTIPRLAIISGVLHFIDGPLNPDSEPENISEMFRPFQALLLKIRELLQILTDEELTTLERSLCSQDEPSFLVKLEESKKDEKKSQKRVKELDKVKKESEGDDRSEESELTVLEIAERLEALAQDFESSRNEALTRMDDTTDTDLQPSSSSSNSIGDHHNSDSDTTSNSDDPTAIASGITALSFPPISTVEVPESKNTTTPVLVNEAKCDVNTINQPEHFTLNKSDSNDSGLHSEVISNSGSMFTISSSDSNQLIGSMEVLPQSDTIAHVAQGDSGHISKGDTACVDGLFPQSVDSTDTLTTECEGCIRTESPTLPKIHLDPSAQSKLLHTNQNSQISQPNRPISPPFDVNEMCFNLTRNILEEALNLVHSRQPTSIVVQNQSAFDVEHVKESDKIQTDLTMNRNCASNPDSCVVGVNSSHSVDDALNSEPSIDDPVNSEPSRDAHVNPDLAEGASGNLHTTGHFSEHDLSTVKSRRDVGTATSRVKTRRHRDKKKRYVRKAASSNKCLDTRGTGAAETVVEQITHQLLDTDGSDTSSYNSECADAEEIALAIEAVETATRKQVRARFRSSSDMIHRLFVCISGVADQLQTNFAGDLRNILRAVFDMNCSEPEDVSDSDKTKDLTPLRAAYHAMSSASRTSRRPRHSSYRLDPPRWIPDEEVNECMACQVPFTFVRRRHHCRNCGKIFCSHCSSNFVPLPHIGKDKPVRVCNRCFVFRISPFTSRTTSS